MSLKRTDLKTRHIRESAVREVAGSVIHGLGTALAKLPRERALAIGAMAGLQIATLLRGRQDIALRNLRIAFPEWSDSRRHTLFLESCANLGRSCVELVTLGTLPREVVRDLADVEGEENLIAAQEASPTGGIIALTAHLGNWEIFAAIMAAHGVPITVVKRAQENSLLDGFISRLRSDWGVELLTRGNAGRAALRAVREGKCLAVPLDQNCNRDEGMFVPFFGVDACTRDGPARIALGTGVPVVPAFLRRIGKGSRHRVCIEPALDLVVGGKDREAAVRENVHRMSCAIEKAVRQTPGEWTWIHRRWHTRPPGEARPYPSRRCH